MTNDNWIKCSERLPKESGVYNVRTIDGSELPVSYVSTFARKMVWVFPNPENIVEWQEPEQVKKKQKRKV